MPKDLRSAIEDMRYRLEPEATGAAGYRAPNPEQGWSARFGAEGLGIETPATQGRAAQRFGMRLKGYGYGERFVAVERAEMVTTGNRVEYRRGSLVEWYVNERRGVEQGFTLQEPPAGGAERERGEALTLHLSVEGSLRAELGADEQSVRFVDETGGQTLTYDQLVAFDARGQELPARMRVEGRELRLEVDDAGAQYPLTIDPLIQQQKLQASDGGNSYFGNAVSVSGETAIVGAPQGMNSAGVSTGAAYVFVRSGGVWSEQQKLLPSDSSAENGFGFTVSISGETAIVGAPAADFAYIFVRSGGVWSEQQQLVPSDTSTPGGFGFSVSINGETAIVGAWEADYNGMRDAGFAYVFNRSGTTWTEQARLQPDDATEGDQFGVAISISGDTIYVAANLAEASNGGRGKVYVYVNAPHAAGQVIISEFRLTGPGGAGAGTDEFFELYNNTTSDITVAASDGSAGWTLRSSDGTLNFTIPNGDVIPARSHYLLANPAGYSLAAYPNSQPGCIGGNCSFPDRSHTSDTPQNTGIALFRTTDPANFNLSYRLDAAGPTTEANMLYREGAGYAPVNGSAGTVQHSLARKLTTGLPEDSGENANDFRLVATDGAATLPGAVLGAPGPENTGSPTQRNASFGVTLLDLYCPGFGTLESACARVRTSEGANPTNAAYGTLRLRRTFHNITNFKLTRLRFRVVDITTTPGAGTADLRLLGATGNFTVTAKHGRVMNVQRLTLEQPPDQPHGGGYNSTASAPTVTLDSPLFPGDSINVEFLLGVQRDGDFRFLINMEALPRLTNQAGDHLNLKTGKAPAKRGRRRRK